MNGTIISTSVEPPAWRSPVHKLTYDLDQNQTEERDDVKPRYVSGRGMRNFLVKMHNAAALR